MSDGVIVLLRKSIQIAEICQLGGEFYIPIH